MMVSSAVGTCGRERAARGGGAWGAGDEGRGGARPLLKRRAQRPHQSPRHAVMEWSRAVSRRAVDCSVHCVHCV
ncbi:unnamed protein product [Lampetra fluviatilis]